MSQEILSELAILPIDKEILAKFENKNIINSNYATQKARKINVKLKKKSIFKYYSINI